MSAVSREANVTVVAITPGERSLDAGSIEPFAQTLLETVAHADPPLVVLDLSQAVFLGSAFIEALFRGWKKLEERGGKIALCGLSPICAEVFRVTKLDTLWKLYPTRGEAVASLSA